MQFLVCWYFLPHTFERLRLWIYNQSRWGLERHATQHLSSATSMAKISFMSLYPSSKAHSSSTSPVSIAFTSSSPKRLRRLFGESPPISTPWSRLPSTSPIPSNSSLWTQIKPSLSISTSWKFIEASLCLWLTVFPLTSAAQSLSPTRKESPGSTNSSAGTPLNGTT